MARAKRPEHEIQAIEWGGRGWTVRCSCAKPMRQWGDVGRANRDAVRHKLREQYGLDLRAATKAVEADAEIGALLSTLYVIAA